MHVGANAFAAEFIPVTDMNNGGRPLWREAWFPPIIMTLVMVGVILSLISILLDTQKKEDVGFVARDLIEAQKSIRFRLKGNLDYLALLANEWASGTLDDTAFQQRAAIYVADHRELVNITRVRADFVIRSVAPLAGNSQIIGLKLTLPEPARASAAAKRTRKAVYTRPFEAIQGKPSFEVWRPVYRGNEFLGLFAAVYSTQRLLRDVISPVTRSHYLRLLDSSGTVLAAIGTNPPPLEAARMVTLSETGLRLAIWPISTPLPRLVAIIAAIAFALAAGMGWAIWMQGREINRRREAEGALREAEARARATFDHAAVGIAHVGLDGRFLHVNFKLCEILGYSVDQLIGRSFEDVTHPDDTTDDNDPRQKFISGELETFSTEKRYVRSDGAIIWGNLTISLVRDNDGGPKYFVAVVEDITARKTTEEALQASEERFRSIVEYSPSAIYLNDRDGRFRLVTKRFEERYGFPVAEVLGKTAYDLFPKENADSISIRDRKVLETGEVDRLEIKIQFADETIHTLIVTKFPVLDADGTISGVGTISTDVTERRQAAEALKIREEQIRSVIEHSPSGIVLKDLEGRFRLVNRRFMERYAVTSEAILGKTIYDILPKDIADFSTDCDRKVLETGGVQENEVETPFADGTVHSLTVTTFPVLDSRGKTIGVGTVSTDVTERRRTEAALRTMEERFRNVAEHSPSAIFLKDLEGRFLLVNRRFEDWYGISAADVMGKTSHDLFPSEIADGYVARDRKVLESGQVIEHETESPFADGTVHTVVVTSFPVSGADGQTIGVGIICSDVTEQRSTEEQLRQAQKMEVIGQLTGGIAHDFNNLLTIIQGNLELIEPTAGDQTREKRLIVSALGATRRGGELTQRLLAFARRQPLSPRSTDVNKLVASMHELLHRTVLGANIEIETALAPDLWPAVVDGTQLENAILNLALNARDAMPDGGRVRIETANVDGTGVSIDGREPPVAGADVMVAISDTGAGMSDEIRKRAFEPFFTTKRSGAGTGLGLSMVYGFVKQSGGHIEISSEPGIGSTVRIYLPKALTDAPSEEKSPILPTAPAGKETILVVEDDADVREYVVNVLELLGYSVIEAGDGPSALALLDANNFDVDLMFTDVVLPGGMSGKDVADAAQKDRPDLKVLFTSGYSEDVIVHHGRLDEGVDLLPKPYAQKHLAQRIRQALGGAQD